MIIISMGDDIFKISGIDMADCMPSQPAKWWYAAETEKRKQFIDK